MIYTRFYMNSRKQTRTHLVRHHLQGSPMHLLTCAGEQRFIEKQLQHSHIRLTMAALSEVRRCVSQSTFHFAHFSGSTQEMLQ